MKAVQRQYRAQAGLYPEDVRVVAPVRHREDAATVREHQQLGLYDGRADGRVHGKQAWLVRDLSEGEQLARHRRRSLAVPGAQGR